MTRINVIDPQELHDKHLLAEYRELPRVFALANAWHKAGRRHPLPAEYTMGEGHVRFFYDKLGYLADRQRSIVAELQRRGFNLTFTELLRVSFLHTDPSLWGMWTPTEAAIIVNCQRIAERQPKEKVS